jgi:hypothetical protein
MINGKKYDLGKSMWHLLPYKQLEYVVEILTFGANKYGENDWKAFVSKNNNKQRYFSAALRHLSAWKQGRIKDRETNMPHLAHAICCLLFVLWKDDKERRNRVRKKRKTH